MRLEGGEEIELDGCGDEVLRYWVLLGSALDAPAFPQGGQILFPTPSEDAEWDWWRMNTGARRARDCRPVPVFLV